MNLNCRIVMVALMVGSPFKLGADLLPHAYEIDSKVVSVVDFGRLNIDGFGVARLWGLIPGEGFFEFVEQNLVGQRIRCDDAGDTFTYKLKMFEDVRKTVTCAADLPKSVGALAEFENRTATLQEFLIDIGLAQEFCVETLGIFGHCVRSSEK